MEARSRLSVQGPEWVCLGLWLLLRLLLIIECPWHVIFVRSVAVLWWHLGAIISVTLLLGVWGVRVCLPRIVRRRRSLPAA